MAEVVKSSAETTLKGLCSRNTEEVEAAYHQAERLSGEEALRLFHLFEKGLAKAQMGELGPVLAMTLLILFGGLIGLLLLTNRDAWVKGVVPMLLVLALGITGVVCRKLYHKEDWDEVGNRLNDFLSKTQSPAMAEATALFLMERMREENTGRRITKTSVIDQSTHRLLLRVLPTLETAQGWKLAGRKALFDLLQANTHGYNLATCIVDTAARWHDVEALPQLTALTRRENCPPELRHHANEVMTLLITEHQKQKVGEELLRGSQVPQQQNRQELLRPATGHAETPPAQLLRPKM